MNNNSKNKDQEIFNIWEKAGNALNNQQQLNKENMETLLSKTSSEFSASQKKLLKADAIFKVALIFGFIFIAAFNLANLFVMATALICIIIGTIGIKQERLMIDGLNDLEEFRGTIRNQLEKDIQFYRNNLIRYPLSLSLSVFLFYILGSLAYHGIKYDVIRPVEDLEDGIVLISLLMISFIFAFVAYYPFFRSRTKYLNSLLKDIEQDEKINDHIDSEKARKKKITTITSILIIVGIVILITMIIAFL
jgi:TRAP-type C4-dicarboxylate transport system permease small subunit